MQSFGRFYLDNEKDIVVDLIKKKDKLFYTLSTPNHRSGNLITNLSKLCNLPLSYDEKGFMIIQGIIPCYITKKNEMIYIFRLGGTKVANIFPNGTIEMKASIPSVSKTLMSQTKNYTLDITKTIIKTYILEDVKFRSDLHTHMNANLSPDILIALGIYHQIRYPLYYVKKLNLRLTQKQAQELIRQRERVKPQFADSGLEGKYLTRKIDDHTYINFADLILNNLKDAPYNISQIRASLAILKDGQAVFTNLEKVYLYRYIFTKGKLSKRKIRLRNIDKVFDQDIQHTLKQIILDHQKDEYQNNSLFQDKLLWIARSYKAQGISYVEIGDTTLTKRYESLKMLKEVHEVMPHITRETGVLLRFLAALRRTPLTIVKDAIQQENYLRESIDVIKAIAVDPYVAGSDIVGEEINDIRELEPLVQELVKIARRNAGFVIRIHAGENDSLRDNVANSIALVKKSLAKGQKMPPVRLGHGLYTPNLNSPRGKRMLEDLKENQVVLEFQITSNVRLNNLISLDEHPLKKYLAYGIPCVQGTDGAALYGTTSIDEQLSLEKLLNLSYQDLESMKTTETNLLKESYKVFHKKSKKFESILNKDIESFFLSRMRNKTRAFSLSRKGILDSHMELRNQIEDLPWDKHPIVIAGGSFSNDKHITRTKEAYTKQLDNLLNKLNPNEVFFVIGHKLIGYEKYLVDHNDKNFKIFSIVPSVLSKKEIKKLQANNLAIRISTESSPMGIYKSFNYEIFERRPFTLIAYDGNSACLNLIQEARNSKGDGKLYICKGSETLRAKANSLQGYVTLFHENEALNLP